MSVGKKEAVLESKDRAAKDALIELEVYVARKRVEIINCPLDLRQSLEQLEGEEAAFAVEYTPWSMGNKVGVSFKLVNVLPAAVSAALI